MVISHPPPQAPKGDVKTQYLKVLVVKIGDDPPQAPEGDVKTQYLKVLVVKIGDNGISNALPPIPQRGNKTQYLTTLEVKIGDGTNLTSPSADGLGAAAIGLGAVVNILRRSI